MYEIIKKYNLIAKEIFCKIKNLRLDNLTLHLCYSNPEEGPEILLKGKVFLKDESNYNKFIDFLKLYKEFLIINDIHLVDDKFTEIKKLTSINNYQETQLNHKNGEILIVHVWSTVFGDSYQNLLNQNIKILNQNRDKWKIVKLISLNVDSDILLAQKKINEKGWEALPHYNFTNGWEDEFLKKHKIIIPQVFIVDKEGSIDLECVPSGNELEILINNLVDGRTKTINSNLEDEEEKGMTIQEIEEIKEKVEQMKLENYDLFNLLKDFTFENYIHKNYSQQNFEEALFRCVFHISINDISPNRNNIDEAIKKVRQLISLYENKADFDTDFTYTKLSTFKVGISCSKCNKSVDNSVKRYICVVCQEEKKDEYTYCFECVPNIEKEDFENFPFHNHHLYYLPPGSDNILDKIEKVLSNCDNADFREDKRVGFSNCFNCRKYVYVCKWSCGVCSKNVYGSYDLCNNCFNDSLINAEFKNADHDPLSHPMARIPYTINAYKKEKTINIDLS